jgi:GAG-pre-integrase domain
MHWEGSRIRKTIPLDNSNLGTIYTVPGYTRAEALYANTNHYEDITSTQSCCYEYQINVANIPKNEGDASKNEGEYDIMFENDKQSNSHDSIEESDSNIPIRNNPVEATLLLLHYKFGHVPMKRLLRLAERGILPKKLAQSPLLICQSCIFGKMTRNQWRSKPANNPPRQRTVNRPGDVISVDQLESQLMDSLLRKRVD